MHFRSYFPLKQQIPIWTTNTSIFIEVVLHKIDLPASLDEGLRGRRGKSPETKQTVTQFRETSELTE